MHKLIDISTSFFGTGIPPGEKLFKVKSGQFANRLLALYSESPNAIFYTYADPPYSNWSEPEDIGVTSANQPVTAAMDDDGNLYMVFTASGSNDLKFLKLTFNAGEWLAGTVETICNAGDNYNPSIVREDSGRLWVSWCHYDNGTTEFTIRVKNSTDNGAAWGTGPDDIGTALSAASEYNGYAALTLTAGYIHVFYWACRTALYYRKYLLSGDSWSDEEMLWACNNMESDFSVASSPDNKVGVAFVIRSGLPGIGFKENDGLGWSGLYRIDFTEDYSPALRYLNGIPYVIHSVSFGSNQNTIKYSHLSGDSFITPEYFLKGMKIFDKVVLYDDDAQTKFCDRTDEAANGDIVADVFHPASSALIADNGDALYLGMDKPFFFFYSILSTVGSGGVVTYAYWNGTEWDSFIPYSGSYNFYSSPGNILLWVDMNAVPADWQKNVINGESNFWIKIEVTSSFIPAPVGSQITAIPQCRFLNIIANI